jgi:hypothetical protein
MVEKRLKLRESEERNIYHSLVLLIRKLLNIREWQTWKLETGRLEIKHTVKSLV